MTGKKSIILGERIEKRIYFIRQHKVMLSTDLAALYEVEPRVLVQAVKRNMGKRRVKPNLLTNDSIHLFKN